MVCAGDGIRRRRTPPLEQTVVQGTASWQAHRLMVAVRNTADNALLGTAPSAFGWQDAAP